MQPTGQPVSETRSADHSILFPRCNFKRFRRQTSRTSVSDCVCAFVATKVLFFHRPNPISYTPINGIRKSNVTESATESALDSSRTRCSPISPTQRHHFCTSGHAFKCISRGLKNKNNFVPELANYRAYALTLKLFTRKP